LILGVNSNLFRQTPLCHPASPMGYRGIQEPELLAHSLLRSPPMDVLMMWAVQHLEHWVAIAFARRTPPMAAHVQPSPSQSPPCQALHRHTTPPRLANRCHQPTVRAIAVAHIHPSAATTEVPCRWAPRPRHPINRLLHPPCCTSTYPGVTSSVGTTGLTGHRRGSRLGACLPFFGYWATNSGLAGPLGGPDSSSRLELANWHSTNSLSSIWFNLVNSNEFWNS
jgi:hypothetical protein